ncbi:family 43 glycosylhydrolase [Plebeiibacterium sediminum]|uniref:Family 43 glycosylhydrolase n=1 Tax=Plebeiibacterium sediminum TaxID=2992112 RepID=A0AAE3SGF2_9BACT|nr:family 43 glycosylhydrolase [Plebeiobacterium sediminum]MCW3788027.1 family 43 glycosylhydrolase [Plebeiobacterium sediminum]
MKKIVFFLTMVSTIVGCSNCSQETKVNDTPLYNNPVINRSLPDPTIVKAEDGSFYLYATEDVRNVPIYRSEDLIHWKFRGTAFTDETRPDFEPKAGIWAPDINLIDGKYVMYYSMSVWGGEWTCGIGVATSNHPEGPFTDQGKLFRSNEIDVQNSIDPFYIDDNGNKYLFWGSFRGIYAIELSADGLSLKEGAELIQIAGTAYEGTYIHKRDGYYYMFASTGTCCEGVNSTYTTVVGRSEELLGPYVDREGLPMMDNHHEILIKKNERFVGTGHNSEIVTDDEGADWVFYHAVDMKNPAGRVLMLDKIEWVNGWPEVKGNTPGINNLNIPIFK